jgi:bifunctional enzyme CysN/CysC
MVNIPFRMPVQYVIRPLSSELHDYRGYAGTIASGHVEVGREISVLPSDISTIVTGVETTGGEVISASASEAVIIRVEDDLDISRGDMFTCLNDRPTIDNYFEATVCWMSASTALTAGAMMRIKHTTHLARAVVIAVEFKVDVNDLSTRLTGDELTLNEVGQVTIKTTAPLIFDKYDENRTTGSFILIDTSTNETVGAGMIGRPTCFSNVSS